MLVCVHSYFNLHIIPSFRPIVIIMTFLAHRDVCGHSFSSLRVVYVSVFLFVGSHHS